MSVFDSLRAAASKIQDATRTINEQIERARTRITGLRRELENARTARVPYEEMEARAPEAVNQRAEIWLKKHGVSLLHHGREDLGYRAIGSPGATGSFNLSDGLESDLFGALCAAHPEQATALLRALVRRVPCDNIGTQSAQRSALIARLEKDLATLEAEEERIVDEAATSGISITHRPEVTHRRDMERLERERSGRS
jgi:DNA repair exonuclease SbcCD ATPase subunit